MSILQRTYEFRMSPTPEQDFLLNWMAGARRWVWNWALARCKAYYEQRGESIPWLQLSSELTALKAQPDTAWLKDADAQALQQVLQDLRRAYRNFFDRHTRFPKFKSSKTDQARFRMPQRVKIDATHDTVYVPKVGDVRIRRSRDIEGETKSATFKRDASGNWHVTLVVAFEMPDTALPAPDPEKVVGLDAGLKDFLVLSNGERVEAPKFHRQGEKKIRRASRVLARRKKGSRRRLKAKRNLAKVYERIRNRRQDFLHKHSTDIIRRFGGVCIEDLCISGLARTKLSKSFTDAAHGEFRRMLEYKGVWNRRHVVRVGRFHPSTKTCGACGKINDNLTLSDRQWCCPGCGAVHDRDLNAACNIKREGLRLLGVPWGTRESTLGEFV